MSCSSGAFSRDHTEHNIPKGSKNPVSEPVVWGEFGKRAQNCTVQIIHISTLKKILSKDYFKAVFLASTEQILHLRVGSVNLKSFHAVLGVETQNSLWQPPLRRKTISTCKIQNSEKPEELNLGLEKGLNLKRPEASSCFGKAARSICNYTARGIWQESLFKGWLAALERFLFKRTISDIKI